MIDVGAEILQVRPFDHLRRGLGRSRGEPETEHDDASTIERAAARTVKRAAARTVERAAACRTCWPTLAPFSIRKPARSLQCRRLFSLLAND